MSEPIDDDDNEPTEPNYAPEWLRELRSDRPPPIETSTYRLKRQLDRLERTL